MKAKLKIHFNKAVRAPITYNLVKKAARITAAAEPKVKGEVEINIISPAAIAALNARYRGKNVVTDVLSFAWQEDKKVQSAWLGQIYICWAQIKKQAKDWQVTEQEEFARLLIHGLLHLVGYAHFKKMAADKMFALQEAIVKRII